MHKVTSSESSQTYDSPIAHTSVQTDNNFECDPAVQKCLEEACKKLEDNCRALEKACEAANEDKDEIKDVLVMEKELNKKLKLEVENLKIKLRQSADYTNANTTQIIHNLEKQCEKLSAERDSISKQLQENKGHNFSTAHVTTLQQQIYKLEKEKSDISNKVVIMTLEQEKLHVLLAARDKQLSDLKQELSGIQGLVSTQLAELQKSSRIGAGIVCSSPSTSVTTIGTSPSWQRISQIANDDKHYYDEVLNSEPNKTHNSGGQTLPITLRNNEVKSKKKNQRHYSPIRDDHVPTKQHYNKGLHGDNGPQGDRTTVKEIFDGLRNQVRHAEVTLNSPARTYEIQGESSSPYSGCDSY